MELIDKKNVIITTIIKTKSYCNNATVKQYYLTENVDRNSNEKEKILKKVLKDFYNENTEKISISVMPLQEFVNYKNCFTNYKLHDIFIDETTLHLDNCGEFVISGNFDFYYVESENTIYKYNVADVLLYVNTVIDIMVYQYINGIKKKHVYDNTGNKDVHNSNNVLIENLIEKIENSDFFSRVYP